jgi:hypothetical protein
VLPQKRTASLHGCGHGCRSGFRSGFDDKRPGLRPRVLRRGPAMPSLPGRVTGSPAA